MLGRDPIAALHLAYAALAMALVSSIAMHPANPGTVAQSLLGLLLAFTSLRGLRVGAAPPAAGTFATLFVYALLALLCAAAPLSPPSSDAPDALRAAMAVVAALSLIALVLHAQTSSEGRRRATVWLVVGAQLGLALLGPRFVPHPGIDVFHLQQSAIDHLLRGENPYTTPVGDVYAGRSAFGYQALYPYPPLNLLLSLPAGALLGDYRYGLTAALLGAVLALRAAGRLVGAAPRTVDLATFALVLHPELERLLLHGWTEPYLVLAVALWAWLHARTPGGAAPTLVLLCTPLLKQYMAVPVLLYLVLVRPRPRALAIGLGAAALVVAPLLAAGGLAVVRTGLLFFVQQTQFRSDSISLPAALHRIGLATSWTPGVPATLAVQLLAGGAAALALRGRGAAGFVLAAALSLWAGFLVAPQAFLNYSFLVGALLLLAIVLAAPPLPGAAGAKPVTSRRLALAVPLVVATLTVGTSLTVRVVDFLVDCAHGADKARARLAAGRAVLDDGAVKAGPDDTIHLCETRHCVGPWLPSLCHPDLVCVCARTGALSEEVAQWLLEETHAPASCRLDEPRPLPTDEAGACRRARCDLHALIP